MRAYSEDLRQAVLAAYEQHEYSQPQVAEVFGVSGATVRNWVRRKRETGSVAALPHRGGARGKLDEPVAARGRAIVQENNSVLLRELCEQVRREFRHRVSEATMCRLLQALGLARKKERCTPVSATRSASSTRARRTAH